MLEWVIITRVKCLFGSGPVAQMQQGDDGGSDTSLVQGIYHSSV
jgi:hypothetical protein